MQQKYILGIDEGTSWVKVLILDHEGRQVGFGSVELEPIFPQKGFWEIDPLIMWQKTRDLIFKVLSQSGVSPSQLAAIGLANQRETTVFWNKKTGRSYGNAVAWLDSRASAICEKIGPSRGRELAERTGMCVLPCAAAAIVKWLLENDPAIAEGVDRGEACFGTVNSWLLWNLTGGLEHCCDLSNMSVTLMQNARELEYDEQALATFGIPSEVLPKLRGTGEVFGWTSEDFFEGTKIPIAAMIGDQQAAALGQGCIEQGMLKNTYGTGSFCVLNTGTNYFPPAKGLISPFLWGDKERPTYGIEGFSEVCGAAVDWLQCKMKIIQDPSETEAIAVSASDCDGLYFVPAFKGLGSPVLDSSARGAFLGITLDTTDAHMVKAVLDGVVYQTTDMVKAMESLTAKDISVLRVDGGMANNDYVCQFQADILGCLVERPVLTESTVLGAIYQAGLTVGFWSSLEETAALRQIEMVFEPKFSASERDSRYGGWLEAVERSKNWLAKEGK